MIQLSYSSLSLLHDHPHCFLNKMMSIPQPEKPEWAIGKKIHRIIQDHVSGKKPDKRFKHIDYKFPIVEEKDFDERCKFEITITFNGKDYLIIGFCDGLDWENRRFLEIKSSDPVWSVGRFQKSFQRKIYALAGFYAHKGSFSSRLAKPFNESVLITCSKNEAVWASQKPKVYKVPITEQDRKDAVEYILEGIKILESGNFLTDLEIINGKPVCTDRWCYWGNACSFK